MPKVIEQPELPPVTDEMARAAEVVAERGMAVRGGDPFTEMVERLAANPDVPVDKLERLLAMQERILDRNAEAAFNAAFAEMAGEIPTVVERGQTDKASYARLEDIIEAVRPVLQKHGFALSHRTEWPEKVLVKVIGILTHREGHSRQSEFLSGADASGSKNAIQGLGSAVAYGRRYTTKDLLNIATSKEDDDGEGSAKAGKPDVKVPAGFEPWWGVMEGLAAEGLAALTKAWNDSKIEFRNHLMATNKRAWNDLKTKAAKVVK